jgi:hypothetical protein
MSDTIEQPKTELWAIVELMGHDKTAGRYTFQDGLHRIDVPRPDGSFVTEMIGNGAIFRLRFVDEAAARMAARSIEPQPIGVWELQKELKRLTVPVQSGETIELDPDDEFEINGDRYDYDDEDSVVEPDF